MVKEYLEAVQNYKDFKKSTDVAGTMLGKVRDDLALPIKKKALEYMEENDLKVANRVMGVTFLTGGYAVLFNFKSN